jgi:hypothetical protein
MAEKEHPHTDRVAREIVGLYLSGGGEWVLKLGPLISCALNSARAMGYTEGYSAGCSARKVQEECARLQKLVADHDEEIGNLREELAMADHELDHSHLVQQRNRFKKALEEIASCGCNMPMGACHMKLCVVCTASAALKGGS